MLYVIDLPAYYFIIRFALSNTNQMSRSRTIIIIVMENHMFKFAAILPLVWQSCISLLAALSNKRLTSGWAELWNIYRATIIFLESFSDQAFIQTGP